jgi:hypothetical protein
MFRGQMGQDREMGLISFLSIEAVGVDPHPLWMHVGHVSPIELSDDASRDILMRYLVTVYLAAGIFSCDAIPIFSQIHLAFCRSRSLSDCQYFAAWNLVLRR